MSISKEFLLPLSDHVRIKVILCTDGIELFVTLLDCNNVFRLEFWRVFSLWHDFVLYFLYVLNIPCTHIFSKSGLVSSIRYREPSNEMLVALAKIFNVTTDYLLGLRNSKNGYMPLTPAEESLIKKIRQLDDDDQEELEAIIDMKITKLRKKNIEKEGIA